MKFHLLTLFLLFVSTLCAQQTGDSLYFLLPTDTMLVETEAASGHIIFEHYLAPGQSLYGAGRFYGLSLDDVYTLNPNLRIGYEAGDKVKIPIPAKAIRSTAASDSLAWFVPINYRMGHGETLFGLYKRTLQHANDSQLMALNPGLNPSAMSANQVVAIGYLKLDGITKELQGEIEDAYVRRNRGLRQLWQNRTKGLEMKKKNGKAAWLSKGDKNKWMVLHRTAPINSLIEVDDPRSRKVLYARVVGRIPEQLYPPDVILVISHLLVKAFGVRDQQFYVRTRHF